MSPSKLAILVADCQAAQATQVANSSHCFSLFTLALVDEDEAAWEAIHTAFQDMVRSWVHRHERFAYAYEEVDFFVNEAFTRLWQYGKQNAQAGRFNSLADYLQYLKKCTWSAIENDLRQMQRDGLAQSVEIKENLIGRTTPTKNLLSEQIGDILWELLNEKEQVAARGIWVYDFKPSEIQARHPDLFPVVQDVYQAKKNILRRLKRQPQLQKLWAEIGF